MTGVIFFVDLNDVVLFSNDLVFKFGLGRIGSLLLRPKVVGLGQSSFSFSFLLFFFYFLNHYYKYCNFLIFPFIFGKRLCKYC